MGKIVKLKNDNLHLWIDTHGGGISRFFRRSDKGDVTDYIYGYNESGKKDGCMGDVLFPWAGRVENKKYHFLGKDYTLRNVTDSNGNALHGFAKDQEFNVISTDSDSAVLSFTFEKEKFAENGYPFDVALQIEYSLSKKGFFVHTEVKNIGRSALPFGLGFHPYFKIGNDSINDLELGIPAKTMVEFDSSLKPTGRLIDIKKSPLNFSASKDISEIIIDNCFTELKYKNGKACTTLKDKKGHSICVCQDENMAYMQVYSADSIGEKNYRKAIALEPQTCCGYALNLPGLGLRSLEPEKVFKCSWGVQIQDKVN